MLRNVIFSLTCCNEALLCSYWLVSLLTLSRLWTSRTAIRHLRPLSRAYSKKRPELTPEAEALDFANRKQSLLDSNRVLYPLLGSTRNETAPAVRIAQFRSKWDRTAVFEKPVDQRVTVQGRVKSLRKSGKGLIFLDLIQDLTKLQVVINRDKANMGQDVFDTEHSFLRRGDIVSITGRPWRTKSGELSLLADNPAQLLTPCFHPLPTNLKNVTTRSHNRVVDLAVNKESRDMLLVRGTVLSYMREFFGSRGFLEVQTPMLADHASGAIANPFTTHSKALGGENAIELALRIAPELWLKRLVVAGFDKVFELGQCFRNEGIDATHNPEFTTCEFYEAYASLEDLITTTQLLLRGVVERVRTVHPTLADTDGGRLDALAAAFAPEFKCLDFVPEIEKCTGVAMPSDLSNVETVSEYFVQIGLKRPQAEQGQAITASKLLDKLAGIYLESQCGDQPTFIINHPETMSPLAKSATVSGPNGPRLLSRRLELFINGKEYANAYEEENSPFSQKQKFLAQLADRVQHNDLESQIPDDSFVNALEWGLPPTGGWGLGVDRLVMLLTGATRIEQVLAFGGVKTVNYQ